MEKPEVITAPYYSIQASNLSQRPAACIPLVTPSPSEKQDIKSLQLF